MKNKYVFIIFLGVKNWLRYTRRPHYSPFNKFGQLIAVEAPFILFSTDHFKHFFKTFYNYFKISYKKRLDPRNGTIIIRPFLLFPQGLKSKFNFLKSLDSIALDLQLNKYIHKGQNKVYFLTSYWQEFIVHDKNSEILRVLDVNDEWSMLGYNDSKRDKIENEVRNLISKVNIVTTVTIQLKNKYDQGDKVYYLPNAVDITHYVPKFDNLIIKVNEVDIDKKSDLRLLERKKNDSKLFTKDLSVFEKLDKPIVGSISGFGGNWSDFDFMYKVEKLLPNKFTLISSGNIFSPSRSEFKEEYIKYLNDHKMIFLGHVDYSILPEFLSNLNVGIVMHRMDEFNTHSAPNKIWAYLAMGLPVVSTNFYNKADKDIFEGLVYFAKTPNEYCDYIVKSMEEDDLNLKIKRRELAIKNSTENRAAKIYHLINQYYDNKK